MIDEKKNGTPEEIIDDTDMEFDEEDFVVELTDEEGKTQKFSILDTIEHEGKEYAVLATEEEPDSVVILEYIENGDEGSFITVDDDETLHAVFDIFVSTLEDCECGCGCDCDCDCDCDDDDCNCDCHGGCGCH